MLPPAHRLRTGEDFRRTVRGGRKAGTRTLVAHLAAPAAPEAALAEGSGDTPDGGVGGDVPRVGFAVSRAVGNAVARNRVKRRLRHLVRDRLGTLPAGGTLVVRALPPAAEADSARLARDLERALERILERPLARTAAPAPSRSGDRP